MKIAIPENRTILTFESDFEELIFMHYYKPEIIVEQFINVQSFNF